MQIRAQILRTIIWSTLFAAFAAPLSHAQTHKDVNYLCTSEMAVGFEYNNSLKKWEAVTVKGLAKPDQKPNQIIC
jgi:hypothetical protein